MKTSLSQYKVHIELEKLRLRRAYSYFIEMYSLGATESSLLEKMGVSLMSCTLTKNELFQWLKNLESVDLSNRRAIQSLIFEQDEVDYKEVENVSITLAESALNTAREGRVRPVARIPLKPSKRDIEREYNYLKALRCDFILILSNQLSVKKIHIDILYGKYIEFSTGEISLLKLREWLILWINQEVITLEGKQFFQEKLGIKIFTDSYRDTALRYCAEIGDYLSEREVYEKKRLFI